MRNNVLIRHIAIVLAGSILVACGAAAATPTSTLQPTAITAPTVRALSVSEEAYRVDVQTLLHTMGTQLENLGTALTRTPPSRELIRSLAGGVRATYTKLAALDVPSDQAAAHTQLLAAAAPCDGAMVSLLAAIDPARPIPDRVKLNDADNGLQQCRAGIAAQY